VIITTGRIRRTLVNKINLLIDLPRSIEASCLAPVKAESIFLRCASGCFGTSRGSSSATSPTPRVRVPRHVTRLVTWLVAPLVVDYSDSRKLVVDYCASAKRPGASACRAARHAARRAARRRLLRLAQARRRLLRLRRASGCLGTSRGSSRSLSRCSSSTTLPRIGSSSTTSPMPRVRVPQHDARLVTRLVAPLVVDHSASRRLVLDYCASASRRLVVDYCTSAARPGSSARLAARHTARRRLLRLRRTSGCLGTSRGSSLRSSSTTPPRAGSSSTTSPTPRVRVPRHVAWLILPLVVDYFASRRLVVDYFTYASCPVASARHTACRATHR
jgi:hypothetical protein